MADTNKKKSLLRSIQDFLASYKGKVILNYAYSWGAAVVILGTLFKLVHLPGANIMLFVGMGTEVLVFFISAFDRPYKSYKWESVFPNLKISGSDYDKKNEDSEGEVENAGEQFEGVPFHQPQMAGIHQGGGAPVIIGGGYVAGGNVSGAAVADGTQCEAGSIPQGAAGITGGAQGGPAVITIGGGGAPVTPGVEVSPEMEEATKAYLEQLQGMTEALNSFIEQTKNLGQDAEQINILNKNLSGINAIYEIQLRSISAQLGTIDEINDQTRKMARQIDELNTVYARMLEAMTVNMNIKLNNGEVK